MLEIRTVDEFEEAVSGQLPVLVDFWASWCGPCKMLAPILEEIANEKEGLLNVIKVNVDEVPQLSSRFGIRGIPTLLLMRNGIVEATKVGVLSKPQMTAFIDSNI